MTKKTEMKQEGNTFKDFKKRNQKKYSRPQQSQNEDYVVGIHPVEEALKGKRSINKILVAKGKRSKQIHDIIVEAKQQKQMIQEVDMQALNRIAGNSAHQGVAAYISPYTYYTLEHVCDNMHENTLVLALNNLTDVHNFGSILRTCDAVGVDYVIIPERRSVQVNATVTKTSSGAVEHVKIVRVKSLGNAIKTLKEKGFWVTGTDMDGTLNYTESDYSGKKVIVSGSEGDGLSPHIKRLCDEVVNIPMFGKVNSLNVSVATSLMLYEWRRQRDAQN